MVPEGTVIGAEDADAGELDAFVQPHPSVPGTLLPCDLKWKRAYILPIIASVYLAICMFAWMSVGWQSAPDVLETNSCRGRSTLVNPSPRPVSIQGLQPSDYWKYLRYAIPAYQQFAKLPAGREHYKLIVDMAAQLHRGDIIFDVGTRVGASAMALAARTDALVRTCDLPDSTEFETHWQSRTLRAWNHMLNFISFGLLGRSLHAIQYRENGVTKYAEMPNIIFHNVDLLAEVRNRSCLGRQLLTSPLVLLDTFHRPETVPFEYDFLDELASGQFSGILLLDDIALNDEMKRFWTALVNQERPLLKGRYTAHDLTALGHWSGTGMLNFTQATGA